MDTPNRMTPKQLWQRIKKGRAAYSAVYAGLSEKQMTRRPGPQADWSVKDQIAHLIWWENLAMLRAPLQLAGEETGTIHNLDEINAQVLAQSEAMSLAEVLAVFEANLARLKALCAGISDKQLNDKHGKSKRPPYWILVTDTFEHYAEHQPDLERYVASLKKKGK
ncbi:MAG: ClbS/DfsB family four-helix bundle protein [Anaerolineales bacterium]|nr:ClbS/DfsB family four-helix bundle protein [Anaerolineales bacterium]MCL4258639.1 ClbS/DfsB family four-helix bundle protein [Anaerolineales bacterium]